MTKKSSKAPASSKPKFSSQTVLDGKNRVPSLSKDETQIREKCELPDDVIIRVPTDDKRPDSLCDGWICFYEYPFKVGHRLPFQKFTQEFLEAVSAPCGQFMPHVWRLLKGVEMVLERNKGGLEFKATDLGHVYDFSTYGQGRITMVPKEGMPHLIVDLDKANDRGWYKKYFFVKKDSLGDISELFSEEWVLGGAIFVGFSEF